MAPTPQIHPTPDYDGVAMPLHEDAVVISGVSTIMPGSRDIMEYADKLYDKVNMVKCGEPRWDFKFPELSKHYGTLPQLSYFDAQFFMVYHRLAHTMDPMTRKLLEQSYQAVFDAGICPSELSGKPIGVFVSTDICESEQACSMTEMYFGIIGSNRAMSANRISYYLNLKGPSIFMDGESAGTAVALEKAYTSIISGQCEAAIVGGAKLMLHPQTSLNYHKIVKPCPDGNVKSYDTLADGTACSETVSVIFLQKYKDAKRVYTSVRHVKTCYSDRLDDNLCQEFGSYRDHTVLTKFLRGFYEEAGVSPSSVEYVEGYGAADPKADKEELDAIDEVFCKGRKTPLSVGSVTSNVGTTNAAWCLTALTKMILAYQRGKIAGNINLNNPRQDVKGLREGRLKILTENSPFKRSLAAINNFSITGINAHVLLEGYFKPKNTFEYHSTLPHLILSSGRQEASVQRILDDIKGRPLDVEEIALLNNIHRIRIPKHLARGFGIYSTNKEKETVTLKENVDYFDDAKRPLWFVYSGMGSQWAGMGAQLMKIPIFAETIQLCHKALEPKGIDLINIVTSPDGSLFDNILHSFVGIAAVQIGLTNVLKAVGLVPDNIIGHSVGELGCAYADGCLTAEEMILSAYSRGLVSLETPFIKGSMAAVGIGYKQIIKLVPPEIEVACHNGPESSTISGPADVMKQFVAQLTEQGVFAKEVHCSNIAYHSRYIAEAGPGLLKYLQQVIKTPRVRSEKWLSSSIPQENWNEPLAQYSAAEYHTNNLLNPVLFEEILTHVPFNAVLVEIAPHGLLQAILKRSLSKECRHIPLTRRGHEDNALFLLEAIGKLYMEGFEIDVSALYPKIDFPVSTETRPLSHLVEWMYSEKYNVCQYFHIKEKKPNSVYKPIISIYDEEHEYLSGNIIDGRRVYPYSGALVLVWDLLAMSIGKQRDHLSVQFKDITFHFQPPLLNDQPLRLTITLQRGSGRFEVAHEENVVAEGYVNAIAVFSDLPNALKPEVSDTLYMGCDEIYKLLSERGYHYKNDFHNINRSNISFTKAQLDWKDNWTTFIDGIFQMNVLRHHHRGISQPQYIKRFCIDIVDHMYERIDSEQTNGLMDYIYSETFDATRCGGVVIEHMSFKDKPTTIRQMSGIKELKFVPFNQQDNNMLTTLYVYLQIVAENLNTTHLSVLHVDDLIRPCILESVKDLLKSPPEIKLKITSMGRNQMIQLTKDYAKPDLVILHELFSDKKITETFYQILRPNTFIINFEPETNILYPTTLYHQICETGKGRNRLELVKWRPPKPLPTTAAISVRNNADLEHLKATKEELFGQHKLIIVAPFPPPSGLKNVVQEWRSESGNDNIFVVMINKNLQEMDNTNFPSFELVFNVLDNSTWGGEYYIPTKQESSPRSNVALKICQFSDLDSVEWVESNSICHEGISVKVHFAALNVYDAKRATAEISIKDSNNHEFGMDFSGVTENGSRVMGLIKSGAVSSNVVANPEFLWPVPKHWSLEDAATVPLPYCLAFYCLAIKSRLVRGMNVLIHGGSGAVGQAAISICIKNQCNVYTTVSTMKKKRTLKRLFPDLPAENIGNSRDETFEDMVINGTKGVGCHVIISCVKGKLKQKTLRCCATSGLTLDIVLIHSQENFDYGMFNMTKSRSYTIVDFASIFTLNDKDEMTMLQQMVSEGILHGYVRPLSRVVYSPQDVPRALRLLVTSRHRGRVLVNLEEPVQFARSKVSCSNNGCHLVLCDRNEFGLLLVDHLIHNGVKKVYVHCEKPTMNLEYKRRSWQNQGAKIKISFEKLIEKDDLIKLLKTCHQWTQVEGIFIVRTNSNDAQSDLRTRHMINELHTASREMDLKLKYFTVIDENGLGNETCLIRAQNKLKSLSVHLHNLEKVDNNNVNNMLKWSTAIDCIQKALHSTAPIVLAYANPMPEHDIIEELYKIPGVRIKDNTPKDTILKQIGIDTSNVEQLCRILKEKFNITISQQILLEMSTAQLQKLHEDSTTVKQELTGLKTYVNFINSDELVANCDMVLMPSLVTTSDLRADDFDNEQTFLCIVPGIEGLSHRFKELCERVKLAALVIHPGFDCDDKTVDNTAQRLANIMKKKLVLHNHFYLLGYEFGILIVLEMARILEKEGLTGTVFCLGGTPESICASFKKQITSDPETLQNDLLGHLHLLATGNKLDEANKSVFIGKEWEEKVELFMRLVRTQCVLTSDYIRGLVNVIYNRITAARDYVCKTQKLKSNVIIINTKNHTSNSLAKQDRYTAIHDLNVSLTAATENMQCASIINKYLEPEVLDVYNRRNHCETESVKDCDQFLFKKSKY